MMHPPGSHRSRLLMAIALFAVSSASWALQGNPPSSLDYVCLQGLIANITKCYSPYPGTPVNPLIRANINKLIFSCSGYTEGEAYSTFTTMRVLAPESYYARITYEQASVALALAGIAVNFTWSAKGITSWGYAVDDVQTALEREDGGVGYDAWMLSPSAAGSLAELGALEDLTTIIQNDRHLDWQDIHPYYRTTSTSYGGKVVMLPFDGATWMMYARHDVLAAHQLTMPATWDELIDAAAAVNGTDLNGDGTRDAAICFAPCLTQFMITSIWASITQTMGVQQGLFYDSDTMRVMGNTSSFGLALQLYQRMHAYAGAPPTRASQRCEVYQPAFAQGRCAFTFGFLSQFKRGSFDGHCIQKIYNPLTGCAPGDIPATEPAFVRGLVTTSPLPGSSTVFSRERDGLEACSPSICPYAEVIQQRDGSTLLVNRVPYTATGGLAGAVNKRVPTANRFMAYSYASFFSYPYLSSKELVHPFTEIGPFRLSQLDDQAMLQRYGISWTQWGYEPSDVSSMLYTVNAALAHPNIAMDLRLPRSVHYSDVLTQAADMVAQGNQPVATAMQHIQSWLAQQAAINPTDLRKLQKEYWVTLNYVPPPAPPTPPGDPAGPKPGASGHFLGRPTVMGPALAFAAAVGVAVIAAAFFVSWRRKYHHKSLLGRVLAPQAGPDTTLLVTDIESSTLLWETCEAHIMDNALRLHHSVMRQLLLRHCGYEAATEGDSFIVAFHTAQAALQFSMDAQMKLLHAHWAPQILAAPPSCMLWSVHQGALTLADNSNCSGPPSTSSFGIDTVNQFTVNISSQFTGSTLHISMRHPSGALTSLPAVPGTVLEHHTVRAVLAAHFPVHVEGKGSSDKVALVHRGLRVRMGMHTGMTRESDVGNNMASARTVYSGETLALARAVTGCAHGGQILLSETTHATIRHQSMTKSALCLKSQAMVWHMGLQTLMEHRPPLHLYMAFPRSLVARAAFLPPFCKAVQRMPGVLEAPLGVLAVAVMTFAGAPALLEWDFEEGSHAVSVFQACCAAVAEEFGGFVSETGPGELVGIFRRCSSAVAWSLHVVDALKRRTWSQALLSHPLCEEVSDVSGKVQSRPVTALSKQVAGKRAVHGLKRYNRAAQTSASSLLAPSRLNSGFSASFDLHIGSGVIGSGRNTQETKAPQLPCEGRSSLRGASSVPEHFASQINDVDAVFDPASPRLPRRAAYSGRRSQSSSLDCSLSLAGAAASSSSAGGPLADILAGFKVIDSPLAERQLSFPSNMPCGMTQKYGLAVPVSFVSQDGVNSDDVGSALDPSTPPSPACTPTVILRGPRIKAGVACGNVRVEISGTTGRVTYQGRAVILAERIVEAAASSQVLCSAKMRDSIVRENEASRGSSRSQVAAIVCMPCAKVARSGSDRVDLYACRFHDNFANDEANTPHAGIFHQPASISPAASLASARAALSSHASLKDGLAADCYSLPASSTELPGHRQRSSDGSRRIASSLFAFLERRVGPAESIHPTPPSGPGGLWSGAQPAATCSPRDTSAQVASATFPSIES